MTIVMANMENRYALVATNNYKLVSIQYVSVKKNTTTTTKQETDTYLISPHDVQKCDEYWNKNTEIADNHQTDCLTYLLSKPSRGFMFACRNGLMSLLKLSMLMMYDTCKHKDTVEGLHAAIIGDHINIVHILRRHIDEDGVNMAGIASHHKRLEILLYEYPSYRREITSLFNDDFKDILAKYSIHKTEAKFKEIINKTMTYACESKYIEIMKLLISYGAYEFKEPTYQAARLDCFDVVALIMENVSDEDEVYLNELKIVAVLGAAYSNNLEMVEKYYVDADNDQLQQLIHTTSSVDILKFCLEKGAIVDKQVVCHAIDTEGFDMIKHLLDTGYDIKDIMQQAIENSNREKIVYLCEQGKECFDKSDYISFIISAVNSKLTIRHHV